MIAFTPDVGPWNVGVCEKEDGLFLVCPFQK